LVVTLQTSGLSLLAPTVTVYAADHTLLAHVPGAGQYGATLSATVNGIVPGQLYYVMVAGAEYSPLGTGKYSAVLNLGTSPTPTIPVPNTQTPNGNPISGGGGQATKFANEAQVNSYLLGNQQINGNRAVAMDASGNFV